MGSSKQLVTSPIDPPKIATQIPNGELDFPFTTQFTESEPRTSKPVLPILELGDSSKQLPNEITNSATNSKARPRISIAPQVSALPKTEMVTPWDFISPVDATPQEITPWAIFEPETDRPSPLIQRNNGIHGRSSKSSQLSISTRVDTANSPTRREILFEPSTAKSPGPTSVTTDSPRSVRDPPRQSILRGITFGKEDKIKKFIRVYDASDNSVMIDVSALQDGKAIKERIVSKITHSHTGGIDGFDVFIRNGKGVVLDYGALFDLAGNQDNADRLNLLVRRKRQEGDDILQSPTSTLKFSPPYSSTGSTPTSTRKTSTKSVQLPEKDERSKRCIRIVDRKLSSHWIDLSYTTDAISVREKIGLKLGQSTNAAIPLMIKRNTEEEIVNDDLLIQICANPEHPFRLNLIADINKPPEPTPEQPAARRARTVSSSAKSLAVEPSKRTSFLKSMGTPSVKTGAELAQLLEEKLKDCIRVSDDNENAFYVEVSGIKNDVKLIRERIHGRFNLESPQEEYRLFLKKGTAETSVDDLTLVEICSNLDHADRSCLLYEKRKLDKKDSSKKRSATISHKPGDANRRSSFLSKFGGIAEKALKAKCVRVFDTKDNSFLIDVTNIFSDPKQLRERIYSKLCNSETFNRDDYELYIRNLAFDATRFIRDDSIDDLTLVEICSNPDHPYRQHLVFDKKRHPKVIGAKQTKGSRKKKGKKKPPSITNSHDELKSIDSDSAFRNDADRADEDQEVDEEDKMAKLADFFGEKVPVKRVTSPKETVKIDDLDPKPKGQNTSKLTDFFGEALPTFTKHAKLRSFFGEDDLDSDPKKKTKKPKKPSPSGQNAIRRPSVQKRLLNLGVIQKEDSFAEEPVLNGKGSKKLENFFGDRPPQQLIAQNLDAFFPGLNKRNSAIQDVITEQINSKRHSKQLLQYQFREQIHRQKELTSRSRLDLSSSYMSGLDLSMSSLTDVSAKISDEAKDELAKKYQFTSIDQDELKSSKTNLHQVGIDGDTVELDPVVPTIDIQLTNSVDELQTVQLAPTESMIDFMEAFKTEPAEPKKINWVQGPLIGMGSFGKVFYGANCETGEIMAVKQVPIKSSNLDPKLRKKMLSALHLEINLLKDLDHPNIVKYLGYYVQDNHINVFLEYVSGGSVTSALALMGSFDEILVKCIVTQVLSGLQYLHEKLIIHRDIKGGNILIDDDGWAKISDFGISKRNVHPLAYQRNSTMSIQGTVYWMAPEVIKGKGYSAKVDIWSLGCVILEMATCRHPWQNLDEIQTLWRLGRFDRPPLPTDISEECKDFLDKTFATSPDDRPSAQALLEHSFCIYDVDAFDFRAYKESAIARKKLKDEEDEMDDDSDDDDSYDDEDDEEESEVDDELEELEESEGDIEEEVDSDQLVPNEKIS